MRTLGNLGGPWVAGLGLGPGWCLGTRLLWQLAGRPLLLGVRRLAGLGR